jgi:rhamnosyltransferase
MAMKAFSSLGEADVQRRPAAAWIRPGVDARVAAVVVTFFPELARLAEVLASTLEQVHHVFVVDNGAGVALPTPWTHDSRIEQIALGDNRGIAAAQNVGIEAALAEGAQFVLLLDQDSVPGREMVGSLAELHTRLVQEGYRVAAVGARPVIGTAVGGFAILGRLGYATATPRQGESFVWCDALLASGTLISGEAWRAVGPMNEDLFIDRVDTEWCVRACAAGWRTAGSADALLNHRLGEQQVRTWPWSRRPIAIHKPFRYHYMARNAIHLMRMPHAGWRLRVAETQRLVALALFFALRLPSGLPSLRMIWRGLIDGLRGRTGPLPDPDR